MVIFLKCCSFIYFFRMLNIKTTETHNVTENFNHYKTSQKSEVRFNELIFFIKYVFFRYTNYII